MLTLAYITARREPHPEWFFWSLRRELAGAPSPNIIMVDAHATQPKLHRDTYHGLVHLPHLLVAPKPSPWQGPHRLTQRDWFAASNARNTALCLTPDGWIAYVDDLSVLMPGWLSRAQEATQRPNTITCGAYAKVKKLSVREDGLVTNYERFPAGEDTRSGQVTSDLTPHNGGWLYGCSCVLPVEALLQVNGWPEDLSDGMGYEDVHLGLVLHNADYKLLYDRSMLTLESAEGHEQPGGFRREDWHKESGVFVCGGNGSDDKSHAALNIALASKRFPNTCDMRLLRAKTLAGEPFPIRQTPAHEWFTGKHLSTL